MKFIHFVNISTLPFSLISLLLLRMHFLFPTFTLLVLTFLPLLLSHPPAINTEELKVKKSVKDAAKRGQTDVAKILARELVQSRKAVSKLYASKAHMNSVVMSMQQQLCEYNDH